MIIIPPRQYCEIADPVVRNKSGQAVFDKYGQAAIQHGEYEIRFNEQYPDPFPLYPQEKLKKPPTNLQIVE